MGVATEDCAAILAELQGILAACGSVAVACSGGVDSSLLVQVALMTLGPDKVLALYAQSELVQEEEDRRALGWLRTLGREQGLRFCVLPWQPLAVAAIRENGRMRCYHCKRQMLSLLQPLQRRSGMAVLVDGTNSDDLLEQRPGLRAARELGVRHPLAEAGCDKAHVRALSRRLGLPSWGLPSASCLATRIPVGMALEPRLLQRVAVLEATLETLGHRGCRARLQAEDLKSLVVETDPEDATALGAAAQERMRQALAVHGIVSLRCSMARKSRLGRSAPK